MSAKSHVYQILADIKRLQAELEDYKVLIEMTSHDLENLLAELVREEIEYGFSVDKNRWSRKMRVQNVLSERR